MMLEDESGRIKLVGDRVKDALLVTGVIIGALGMENQNGEFEVVDICFPEMAPQYMSPEENELEKDDTKMDVDGTFASQLSFVFLSDENSIDKRRTCPTKRQMNGLASFQALTLGPRPLQTLRYRCWLNI